ncbi:MAG: hypothetical protein FWE38_01145 [Firmicutes bacterium]|nr:hypothetical protein [Bacillota bacterium]
MNYRSCKKIHESFILAENNEPHLAVRNATTGEIEKTVPITSPMEKGYIYASLFFFDEVDKEVIKLNKMIQKVLDELQQEVNIDNPTLLLMELSNRVKNAIGDDSLDALIKEMLAAQTKAIALMPDAEEMKKLMVIKEAIYTELFNNFVNMTFKNSKDVGGFRTFKFTNEYVETLTERQKKLLAPAIRMAGFINQLRLDGFELQPDWSVRFKPHRIEQTFNAREDEIKTNLKRLMEEHFR